MFWNVVRDVFPWKGPLKGDGNHCPPPPPNSVAAKKPSSSPKIADSKDVDEELGMKDVEAGEMPLEEEEMLEDMPVDWSIVACSVIFGLGLGKRKGKLASRSIFVVVILIQEQRWFHPLFFSATVLLYFSIRNLVRAQQLIGPFTEKWMGNEGNGGGGNGMSGMGGTLYMTYIHTWSVMNKEIEKTKRL